VPPPPPSSLLRQFSYPASLCFCNGCFTGPSATIDFATFVEDFRLVSPLPELKLIQPRPTHSNGLQFGCPAENLNPISDGNVAVSQGKLPRDVMASFNKKLARNRFA